MDALPSRSLERTPTWAVAVVCFVLIVISIIIEYILHSIGKWLKKRHKLALNEALEKVKAELMLLGFISLLLVVVQEHIAGICIATSIANTWHPCKLNNDDVNDNYSKKLGSSEDVLGRQRKLLFNNHQLDYSNSYSFYSSPYTSRRILSSYPDYCTKQGKVAFMSTYAIHQLHIFIFVLAVVHVLYSILTMTLSRAKMKSWKKWEYQTRTVEYQYTHDPERFRFARNTTFGRRHLSFWSKTPILLWIVCFFRQFFRSVLKVDYMTLRHGFIMAHLAPQSANKFDFQKYIQRSLEDDFKVVVGISPIIWFFAVLFIMSNTHGWFAYLWLPFIPLIIILLVGTKLQVIITKMGVGIQDKGDVVRGVPMVKPTDDLFWFNRPRFMLSLIHFVLFQNAFQLAFFVYTTYEFGLRSCYHEHVENIVIQISMGILIQFLCSYVTLPLYALVTQMGSTMKPTIFNERVATALKQWHHTAKKHTKHHEHSSSITPMSSMPTTPTHGSSPIHLLHNHQIEPDSADNEHWESDGSPFHSLSPNHKNQYYGAKEDIQEVGSTELQSSPSQTILTVDETMDGSIRQQQINTRLIPGDFSFDKRP